MSVLHSYDGVLSLRSLRTLSKPTVNKEGDVSATALAELQRKANKKNKLLLAKKETVEFTHDPFTDS